MQQWLARVPGAAFPQPVSRKLRLPAALGPARCTPGSGCRVLAAGGADAKPATVCVTIGCAAGTDVTGGNTTSVVAVPILAGLVARLARQAWRSTHGAGAMRIPCRRGEHVGAARAGGAVGGIRVFPAAPHGPRNRRRSVHHARLFSAPIAPCCMRPMRAGGPTAEIGDHGALSETVQSDPVHPEIAFPPPQGGIRHAGPAPGRRA